MSYNACIICALQPYVQIWFQESLESVEVTRLCGCGDRATEYRPITTGEGGTIRRLSKVETCTSIAMFSN